MIQNSSNIRLFFLLGFLSFIIQMWPMHNLESTTQVLCFWSVTMHSNIYIIYHQMNICYSSIMCEESKNKKQDLHKTKKHQC